MRVFLVVYLISLNSFASLKGLVGKGLSNSSENEIQALRVKKTGLDLESFETATNLSFFFEGSYEDTQLQRPILGFISSNGSTKDLSLGLSKTFSFGGKLTLLNNYMNDETIIGTVNNRGFSQTLRYEQSLGKDLFGAAYKSQKEVFAKRKNLETVNLKVVKRKQLFELAQAYLRSKFLKTSLALQKKSTVRSYKQLKLVKRKFRDGLLEKVDQREAEVAYYVSKENEEKIRSEYISSKVDIEKILERPISEADILEFNLKISKIPEVKGSISKNIDLEVLMKQKEINQVQSKQFKTDFLPNINFLFEYGTNAFSDRASRTFKEGHLGKDNDYKKIGLNASWDFGESKSNIEKRKNKIDELIINRQISLLSRNIKSEEVRMKNNFQTIEQQIKYALQRKESARKSLIGYERLYKKGRVELDQLIRSENSLINSELGLVSKLQERLFCYFSLAYLYGEIETAITRYVE